MTNGAGPSSAFYAGCEGYTVNQVISAAGYILGGNCSPSCSGVISTLCTATPAQISNCLDAINDNYDANFDEGRLRICTNGGGGNG
jgi:hypothetical protein